MNLSQAGDSPPRQRVAAPVRRIVWPFAYGLLAALMWLTTGVHAQGLAPNHPQMSSGTQLEPFKATGGYRLAELIDLALANNPELAAVAQDGQAAAARTRAAQAASYPRVAVEGGYTYYGDDLRLTAARFNGELGAFGSQILSADVVLRMPLATGGRLLAELTVAELLEAASGHRLSRSRSDLAFNVSSLYYTQLAQARLIDALAATRDALAGQLNKVQALVTQRKAAQVDALRVEVKLADMRQRLLREQNTLTVLRRALLNTLGQPDGLPNFVLQDNLTTPAVPTTSLSALVADALTRRADVLAAQAEVAAQSARIDAARSGTAASVNLVAAVGGRSLYGISQQPPGIDGSNTTGRIGVTLELPLFDGGRTEARVAEESAKLAAQQARLDKLRLQVRLEVETAHGTLRSALERLSSATQLTQLASENLNIEQEKYALARGTVFDVLDAQAALTDAQSTQIRALADANTAAAQLAWASAQTLP